MEVAHARGTVSLDAGYEVSCWPGVGNRSVLPPPRRVVRRVYPRPPPGSLVQAQQAGAGAEPGPAAAFTTALPSPNGRPAPPRVKPTTAYHRRPAPRAAGWLATSGIPPVRDDESAADSPPAPLPGVVSAFDTPPYPRGDPDFFSPSAAVCADNKISNFRPGNRGSKRSPPCVPPHWGGHADDPVAHPRDWYVVADAAAGLGLQSVCASPPLCSPTGSPQTCHDLSSDVCRSREVPPLLQHLRGMQVNLCVAADRLRAPPLERALAKAKGCCGLLRAFARHLKVYKPVFDFIVGAWEAFLTEHLASAGERDAAEADLRSALERGRPGEHGGEADDCPRFPESPPCETPRAAGTQQPSPFARRPVPRPGLGREQRRCDSLARPARGQSGVPPPVDPVRPKPPSGKEAAAAPPAPNRDAQSRSPDFPAVLDVTGPPPADASQPPALRGCAAPGQRQRQQGKERRRSLEKEGGRCRSAGGRGEMCVKEAFDRAYDLAERLVVERCEDALQTKENEVKELTAALRAEEEACDDIHRRLQESYGRNAVLIASMCTMQMALGKTQEAETVCRTELQAIRQTQLSAILSIQQAPPTDQRPSHASSENQPKKQAPGRGNNTGSLRNSLVSTEGNPPGDSQPKKQTAARGNNNCNVGRLARPSGSCTLKATFPEVGARS
eukprot:gene376-538_t